MNHRSSEELLYIVFIRFDCLLRGLKRVAGDDSVRMDDLLALLAVLNVFASVFLQMPQHLFGTAGFGYTGAMVLSTEALKYVNFPTKVLGKSCKVR